MGCNVDLEVVQPSSLGGTTWRRRERERSKRGRRNKIVATFD